VVVRTGDVTMSRILVVYGTKTGCTEGVAERIGATLAEGGAEVEVRRAEDKPDAAAYDAVVVGSGVRAGSWHGAVKQWVSANADALKSRPTAFFTACLTMAAEPEKADEVRAYTDGLIAGSGVQPVDIGLFAGMNELARFSLPERLIMKAMKAPQGDFRDFEAVEAWAREIAGRLEAS
jgi:menaquinone-dependent protoporphyrinogen oxidase